MLHRRDQTAALCAGDLLAGDRAGQQRIFRDIFEIAAAAGIADEIGGASEQDVEALGARFGSHRLALAPRQIDVEACRHREIGRHRGRGVAVTNVAGIGDAELGVGFLQGGESEAGRPGDVARRTDRARRFGLIPPGRAEPAMDPSELLASRHFIQRQSRALFGRERGVAPRPLRGSCRNDRGQECEARTAEPLCDNAFASPSPRNRSRAFNSLRRGDIRRLGQERSHENVTNKGSFGQDCIFRAVLAILLENAPPRERRSLGEVQTG